MSIIASFGLPIVLSYVLGSLLYEQENYETKPRFDEVIWFSSARTSNLEKTIDAKVTDVALVLRNYQETQIITQSASEVGQNGEVSYQLATESIGGYTHGMTTFLRQKS